MVDEWCSAAFLHRIMVETAEDALLVRARACPCVCESVQVLQKLGSRKSSSSGGKFSDSKKALSCLIAHGGRFPRLWTPVDTTSLLSRVQTKASVVAFGRDRWS
eukprot:scaffold6028_cov105-Pinguiococcus_pyrenoidosus.AAC.1